MRVSRKQSSSVFPFDRDVLPRLCLLLFFHPPTDGLLHVSWTQGACVPAMSIRCYALGVLCVLFGSCGVYVHISRGLPTSEGG